MLTWAVFTLQLFYFREVFRLSEMYTLNLQAPGMGYHSRNGLLFCYVCVHVHMCAHKCVCVSVYLNACLPCVCVGWDYHIMIMFCLRCNSSHSSNLPYLPSLSQAAITLIYEQAALLTKWVCCHLFVHSFQMTPTDIGSLDVSPAWLTKQGRAHVTSLWSQSQTKNSASTHSPILCCSHTEN